MFCPKCGSLMYPNNNGELVCPNCGFKEKINLENKIEIIEKAKHKEIVLIEDTHIGEITTDWICPKCGYNKAYVRVYPPTRGDEDEIIIYTCVKCGYTERETTKVL